MVLSRAQRLARSDAEDFAEMGRTSTGLVIRRDLGRISDRYLRRISGAPRVYLVMPQLQRAGRGRKSEPHPSPRARVPATRRVRRRISGVSRANLRRTSGPPPSPSSCVSNGAAGRVPYRGTYNHACMQQVRLPGHRRARQPRPGANRAPGRRERRGVVARLSRHVHTTRVGVGVGARRNNRRDRRDRAVP